MDDVIGIVMVFGIIFVLIYALAKLIQYRKEIEGTYDNSVTRQKLKRKNSIMIVSLSGIIIFYTLNVFVGLGLVSSNYVSSNVTAIGIFISFIIFLISKFCIGPKDLWFPKSFFKIFN